MRGAVWLSTTTYVTPCETCGWVEGVCRFGQELPQLEEPKKAVHDMAQSTHLLGSKGILHPLQGLNCNRESHLCRDSILEPGPADPCLDPFQQWHR